MKRRAFLRMGVIAAAAPLLPTPPAPAPVFAAPASGAVIHLERAGQLAADDFYYTHTHIAVQALPGSLFVSTENPVRRWIKRDTGWEPV